ncbi:glycosyltransferase [Flavobacterium sp. GA093]|uniref:Glycosyltransferase n=1 Tax=Flavobacterium hydrocarbonoxydans TaxID=2683249 RepID=A0A6I4NJ84_9FLAO|nr:glycosyltransferase [Flavobacterium hydrocarbonoxydans]MWB94530.1 glycosyltransferase [Flavobacterium hydrocarbonoxydans]
MRILQIIDSLEAGGAERMAVNYANALSKKINFSGLIATRNEGVLLDQVVSEVSYLFLKKRKTIDFKAIIRLRKYIKENKVDVIQAHSSSFFIAVLVKFTLPKVKIIWHDHYGISQNLVARKSLSLKLSSLFFNGNIAVNQSLKNWAQNYLLCPNSIYLPNFIEHSIQAKPKVILNGIDGKRIICVANLRKQKNHNLLLKVADKLRTNYPDWTFHLFGKDFNDEYSVKIKSDIQTLKLEKNVFFYGTSIAVSSALDQSDIAVLTSESEGLPLVVLEYGLHRLAVVATNVGEISNVIISGQEGIIVASNDVDGFTLAVEKLIGDEILRKSLAVRLHTKVELQFTDHAILEEYFFWLNSFNKTL